MRFQPRCMATMIGSLPHSDPEAAVRLVLDHLDEAPIWPELPGRSFQEEMVPEHVEGLPGLRLDLKDRKVWIDTASEDLADELAAFYERAMAAEESGDLSAFSVGPRHASALQTALKAFESAGKPYPCVKTHCIGPVSMQLSLADGEGRPLYYDEQYQDVLVRQISLRGRWLARKFRPFGETLIAFLDEPSLAAFGSSAYVGVLRDDVVARLGAAIEALKSEGAVVGVHVCGNSDWPMILDAGADILNYDAYGFGESMLMYSDRVGPFLEQGGVLAWGIVPTSEAIRSETVESLEQRFIGLVDGLAGRGVDRLLILEQSMITPACGLGPMPQADAVRALSLLSGLSRSVQSSLR